VTEIFEVTVLPKRDAVILAISGPDALIIPVS